MVLGPANVLSFPGSCISLALPICSELELKHNVRFHEVTGSLFFVLSLLDRHHPDLLITYETRQLQMCIADLVRMCAAH